MIMRDLSRRRFVQGTTASLLLAPFLRSRELGAAPASPPKRFIVVFSALGTVYDLWRPTGDETNFTLPLILSPLEPHKSNIVVVDGLDHQIAKDNGTCDHAAASSVLTGQKRVDQNCLSFSTGMSLDVFLSQRLGADRPVAHLALAATSTGDVMGVPSHFFVSQSAANGQVTPYTVPAIAFDRLFGDMLLGEEQAAKIRPARLSAIDTVADEIKALKSKLGQDGAGKLDAHLTSFRELEKRVAGGSGCSAQPIDASIPTKPNDPAFGAKVPDTVRAHMDIIAMAMACDMTRVATLQLFGIGMTYSWTGAQSNHHELSHNRGTDPNLLQAFINDLRWQHEMFAYLIAKLKSIPEGSGTMLDNTLVLFASEMGEASTHHFGYVPFLLAGGAGGAIRTGRHLMYGGAPSRAPGLAPGQIPFSGVPHNRLLLSICHALGQTDVQSFGDPAYNTGGLLPGLVG